MNLVRIATWSEVPDGVPTAAMAENVELVIVRRGDEHSVLHGRCLHRGALLADGTSWATISSAVCTVGTTASSRE